MRIFFISILLLQGAAVFGQQELNPYAPPEQLDINNKAFWATISSNFEDAMKLLHKAAENHGFDFNTPMSAEEEANYKKGNFF